MPAEAALARVVGATHRADRLGHDDGVVKLAARMGPDRQRHLPLAVREQRRRQEVPPARAIADPAHGGQVGDHAAYRRTGCRPRSAPTPRSAGRGPGGRPSARRPNPRRAGSNLAGSCSSTSCRPERAPPTAPRPRPSRARPGNNQEPKQNKRKRPLFWPRRGDMCKRAAPSFACPGWRCDLDAVRIGIDVGGTKIEGLLLGDDGRELARQRVATPSAYDEVLGAIADLVSKLEQAAPGAARATVGVGTPGFLQPGRGVIWNANLLSLNNRPLDRDLVAALGRPVRLANDAKCFVLSEAIDGAAAPPAGSRPLPAGRCFRRHAGHGRRGRYRRRRTRPHRARTAPPPSGATPRSRSREAAERSPYECVCRHPGCIESFISGRGLEGTYRALGGRRAAAGPRSLAVNGPARRRPRRAFDALRRPTGAGAGFGDQPDRLRA